MKIQRAYKTKLRLNNRERDVFNRCAEASRYIYNWALSDRIERYQAGGPTNYYDQKKRFNAMKDDLCPWIRDVPYTITESAFRNLDAAYKNFFRRVKNGENPGFPKFKSKHGSRKSFTVRGVQIEDTRIRLPKLGWFRFAEKGYLPTGTFQTNGVTISEDAGNWYVSIQIEEDWPERNGHNGVLGVDLGVKTLATCSDGTRFDNPRVLKKYEKKLARLQRELSRRQKGSANWAKTKKEISSLHSKIRHVREHTQHRISRHVTAGMLPKAIVIEDLNVAGMIQNHCLAKAISDAGLSELARQIKYKAEWHGIETVQAGRWFPSSKLCSQCGSLKGDLTLADRTYRCDKCGLEIDRDLNAAKNLAALVNL